MVTLSTWELYPKTCPCRIGFCCIVTVCNLWAVTPTFDLVTVWVTRSFQKSQKKREVVPCADLRIALFANNYNSPHKTSKNSNNQNICDNFV